MQNNLNNCFFGYVQENHGMEKGYQTIEADMFLTIIINTIFNLVLKRGSK